MARRVRIAIVAAAVSGGLGLPTLPTLPAQAADAGTISGVAFEDANRNGIQDAGEVARAGDTLWLKDSTGTAIAAATTDSNGGYSFGPVPSGSYSITYASTTWWNIRSDWVPTTSAADARPVRTFTVPSPTQVNFGWRHINRTVPPAPPVARYVGPEGLVVESYDDVVDPAVLYRDLATGTLGAEASTVRVMFDASGSSTTSSGASVSNGRYTNYSSTVYVAWASWLDDHDRVLSHEYGHAWSLYYAYIVQQDPSLTGYLSARGLSGDARVGSSYEWGPRELIAEDYRQLLGAPTGATAPQANADIPPASAVPGLAEYLRSTFTQSPASGGSPTATPAPTPSASSSPTPTASPTTTPSSPTPSPTATATPSPSPSATSNKPTKGGCTKRC
jgi:hypothetical protein